MVSMTILFGVGIVFFFWIYNKFSRPRNYPPGPFTFPLLGVFPHFIRTKFINKIQQWRAEYGDIMSISFGLYRVILLHDLKLIKEAYNMDEFTGRALLAPVRLIAGEGRRGLIASEGAQWEAQRRFALRHLRDFGFGKKSMEGMAHEDISDLIGKFRKDVGQPITTTSRFNMSVINSLWQIIAGQRYDIDDPNFLTLTNKIHAAISTAARSAPAFTIDWLTTLAPELTGWNKFKTNMLGAKSFIKEQIEAHEGTFQEGNFRDFMDVFINEMKQTKDPNSSFYGTAGKENLLVGTQNLFGAGTETTSASLSWALFYLSRNPLVQKKFQEELDRVVGRSRLPSLNDKDAMPYVSATVLEVLRNSSFVPLGIPHCTLRDIQFHGYTIPKNTMVVANLYDVHHNRGIWGDPEVFRPERFLTPDGSGISKDHPPMAPFSIGRRVCLGETLARNNIFLFLTGIFQTFDINEPLPRSKGDEGDVPTTLFRFPPNFKVVFEERNLN